MVTSELAYDEDVG